jgi:hypothetical protein
MENASMNKGLKGLLVALIAVGSAVASDSNNKTHLNTLMYRGTVPAYTTFHEMQSDKNTDMIGGNLEITGFYARSFNDEHLAKNFGANGTTQVQVVSAANLLGLAALYPTVPGDFFLHRASGTNPLAGILKFAPKQIVYGAQLDYYHRFDKWVDGLFASICVPFLRVTNDINLRVEHDTAGGGANEAIVLSDLFTGKTFSRVAPDATTGRQDTLTSAKMLSSSKTDFGDVTAKVGYKFIEGSKCHVGINAAVVFPTGSEPDAQFKWAARTGDSKWALGGGADGSAVLWEDEDQNLKVIGALNYKYLFSGTERRTIGLKTMKYHTGSAVSVVNDPILSEYYLIGRKNSIGLRPLANITTMDVKVEMGSQLDGTVALAYNNAGFTLDVGYNLFWREAERVSLKAACTTTSTGWREDTYAVADKDYDSSAAFVAANTLAQDATGYLKATDLDPKKAETPAYSIHKLFCGVGYIAKNWEYPVMVGTGVSYEFPSCNRDAAEGYSFWAKAGIAF